MIRPLPLPPLLLLPLLLVTSCNLLGLRREVGRMESAGSLLVRVTPPPAADAAPAYAAAWRMKNGAPRDYAGFQRVRPDGLAGFRLKLDEVYRVGVFSDENRNGAADAGEPVDFVKDVRPFSLTDPAARPRTIGLTLRRDAVLPPDTAMRLPRENKALGGRIGVAAGEVASLDEPRFAAKAGGGGLWRPLEFLGGDNLGVFFTEPYDPRRIPVIFVYGIGGSPQDWRYLLKHFDRARYQCWFYNYPSGMRLERAALALSRGLLLLKKERGFSECHLVAHSMGGLVSRRAIDLTVTAAGSNFIPKFVTISTPWSGHQAAESGLRHLKKPVPAWIDVAPNSAFLQSLYAAPLPSGTRHWLLYGHKSKRLPWLKGENDGVVLVASETDPRIRRHATAVSGYPFQHEEILFQDTVLKNVEAALAAP